MRSYLHCISNACKVPDMGRSEHKPPWRLWDLIRAGRHSLTQGAREFHRKG